jgi:hypothetical protein
VSEVFRKNKKRGVLSSQMITSHDNTQMITLAPDDSISSQMITLAPDDNIAAQMITLQARL